MPSEMANNDRKQIPRFIAPRCGAICYVIYFLSLFTSYRGIPQKSSKNQKTFKKMDRLEIQTTQNVAIRNNIASIGDRIGAQIIDAIIQFIYLMLVISLSSFIGYASNGEFIYVGLIIMLLPIFFYHLLCEWFLNGQSLGKKALKIKVVKLDGSVPTIGSYLLRWLFRFIDVSLFNGIVAIVTIAINGKGQRLGDIVAGTTVVKLQNNVNLRNTVFMQIPDDYQATFQEVRFLEDEDIETIKEVLRALKRNPDTKTFLHAENAKKAIEAKMGVDSDLNAREFLITVIKDYNFIHREVAENL